MSTLGQSTSRVNPTLRNTAPAGAIPYPSWHAVSSELLARHRELGLSYGEVCLYSILAHYSRPDENGVPVCRARNKILAREMGCVDSEVRRFLKGLEDAGLVGRATKDGREKSRAGIYLFWQPGDPAIIAYQQPETHLRREALVGADCDAPTPESAPECTPESAPAPTPESARTYAGKRSCNEIPSEREKESMRTRTAPPPASARNEPAASPGSEDGTGLPPGFNVTGLGRDSIRRAIQSGVEHAVQGAPASQGEAAEGGGVFDRSRIPRALRDARGASRGPTRKLSAHELRAQVEALRARRGKDGPHGAA